MCFWAVLERRLGYKPTETCRPPTSFQSRQNQSAPAWFRGWSLTACFCSQRAQAALRAFGTSHVAPCAVASSSVLRVVVENLVYPVSLDALCQVSGHDGTEAAFLRSPVPPFLRFHGCSLLCRSSQSLAPCCGSLCSPRTASSRLCSSIQMLLVPRLLNW